MSIANNECAPHEFLSLLYGNVPDGALEVTYIAPDGIDLKPHTLLETRLNSGNMVSLYQRRTYHHTDRI